MLHTLYNTTQDANALELVFSTNSADTAVVSAVVLDDAGGGLLQLQQEAAVAVAPTAAPLQSLRLLLRPSKRVATKLRAQVGLPLYIVGVCIH